MRMRYMDHDSEDYTQRLSEFHVSSARKLLELCKANGGIYVKAGQFVSSLSHLPKEFTTTLEVLQDRVCYMKSSKMKD